MEFSQKVVTETLNCPARYDVYADIGADGGIIIGHGEHIFHFKDTQEYLEEVRADFPWLRGVCKLSGHTKPNNTASRRIASP